MKLGILTGGGDVPGLNPCIKAVVNRAIEAGYEIVGIRRGWAGLLNYNPDDDESAQQWLLPLSKHVVRTVDRTGGTFLHTSRTNPGQVRVGDAPEFLVDDTLKGEPDALHDFTPHILQNLAQLKIDVLIPIGGDDTLNYGYRIHQEGFPIVAIPKTMDNDVYGTDYCLGFSTGITRSVNFIHNLRTSVGSHERIGVIELFGRNSGETSLISAYLADVDRAIISEVPFDPQKLAGLLMKDKKANPSNYAIMTISEGASIMGEKTVGPGTADVYGHKKLGGIGQVTGDLLKEITGQNIIYQQVGYLMRSGAPDAIDLMIGFNYANMAMDLITENNLGQMVALREGKYTSVPADVVAQGNRQVDVGEFYDVDAYRPKVRQVNQKPMFLY
jgi:6-phosphofructokinase 1